MPVRKPLFAANWKMHHGPSATRAFVAEFERLVPPQPDRTLLFFPPAVSLTAFAEASVDRPDLLLGVQDVHPEDRGAFTGAVSAPMAKEAGARFALVGHSERRRLFGDSDEVVAAKLRAALRNDLTPLLCVGETLEEREAGRAEEVVTRQLDAALGGLAADAIAGVLIAYEPVWAIGTGRNARPQDAGAIHRIIEHRLARLADDPAARTVPVRYGGSVTPENIEELLAEPGIEGVLVGGASLKPESFAAICTAGR